MVMVKTQRRDGVESMRPRLRPRKWTEQAKNPTVWLQRDGAGRGTPAPFDLMHFEEQQGKGARGTR